jgi:hypothetical protein
LQRGGKYPSIRHPRAKKDFVMAHATTCPGCEFTHGTAGRPVACEGGLMRCEECNCTWREMGMPSAPIVVAGKSHSVMLEAPRARIITHEPPVAPHPFRISGDGVLWLSAAIALFCLLVQPFWLIGKWDRLAGLDWPSPWRAANIEISMLSARQLEHDGRIAVRIEGRIVNTTDKRQALGDVDIVLSQSQGHRVYSWKHRPAVSYLDPGQSIRFSTANGEVPEAASSVEIRSAGAQTVARL